MKIKCDFVTNSSSTAYCMYGKWFSMEEVKNLLLAEREADGDGYYDDSLYEALDDTGLDFQIMEDDILIGICPTAMKDDQTLREFKTQVIDALREAGFDVEYRNINLEFGEYYDG